MEAIINPPCPCCATGSIPGWKCPHHLPWHPEQMSDLLPLALGGALVPVGSWSSSWGWAQPPFKISFQPLVFVVSALQPPPTAACRWGSQGRLTGIFRTLSFTAAISSPVDTGAAPYHCGSLCRSINQSGIAFSSQEQDPSTLGLLHLWQQFFSNME